MGSTYISMHFHLIIVTKYRKPTMLPAWRNQLHAYLGGCVHRAGGFAEAVGGVADHVHLLVGLRPTHRVSDVMRDIKIASSKWVHAEIKASGFAWQDGYACFSVNYRSIEVVRAYIRNQEAHHRRKGSRQEYLELLREHKLKFEEQYIV